jgi:hypothetical protein
MDDSLHHNENENSKHIQHWGVTALRNVAELCVPVADRIAHIQGLFSLVLDALRMYEYDHFVHEALALLHFTCKDLDSNSEVLIACDHAAPTLLSTMRSNLADVDIAGNASCPLLCTLTQNRRVAVHLAAAGAVRVLLSALRTHTDNDKVQQNGLQALCNLAHHQTILPHILAHFDSVEWFVSLMRKDLFRCDPLIQLPWCLLFQRLAVDQGWAALVLTDGVPLLLMCLKSMTAAWDHIDSAKNAARTECILVATRALRNLLAHPGLPAVVYPDWSALRDAMRHCLNHEDVQRHALWVLHHAIARHHQRVILMEVEIASVVKAATDRHATVPDIQSVGVSLDRIFSDAYASDGDVAMDSEAEGVFDDALPPTLGACVFRQGRRGLQNCVFSILFVIALSAR